MGRYITQSDIEQQFGTDNVAVWSNVDSDSEVADTYRIDVAISVAEEKVENFFRGSKYIVPLIPTVGELATVKDWCSKLAGVWLYESRGAAYADGDEEQNRYAKMKSEVYKEMSKYANGVYSMNAKQENLGTPSGPVVV